MDCCTASHNCQTDSLMNTFYDAGPRIVLHHSALLESVDNGESGVLNHIPGRAYMSTF